MALQRIKLMNAAYVAASLTAVYDNPASTRSYVRGVILHNTNSITENVAIHFVGAVAGPVLGTADNSNRILYIGVQPSETRLIEIPFSLVLVTQHDAIFASTGTASKVTIVLTGDTDV